MPNHQTWRGVPAAVTNVPADAGNDQRSTEQTVRDMVRMTQRAARSPEVQRWAGLTLAGALGPIDRRGVCGGVFRAVRALPFQTDAHQLGEQLGLAGADLDRELLVAPEILLRQRAPSGDCDCKAMLGAACLLALGIPCRFIVMDRNGRRWEHVYCEAELEDGKAHALDFSHGAYPGWRAPRALRQGRAPLMRPPHSDAALKRSAAGGLGFEFNDANAPGFWKSLLGQGVTTGLSIAEGRFGGGSLPTFQMTQLPGGGQTVIQRGGTNTFLDPTGAISSINPLWLLAAAGGALFLLSKR